MNLATEPKVLSVPILTFHALDNRSSIISFLPKVFRHGIARLHENGYRTLTLTDAAASLRTAQPLPARSFVMTFDDGYQSVYDEAFPVMREHGMRATVFLTVGKAQPSRDNRLPSMSDRSMLNWREISEMADHGISFGAHTLTHPDLTRVPPERMQEEIHRSKIVIEDRLGSPVNSFAYPYGRYDQESYDVVGRYFSCACSDRLGMATHQSKPYALERVDAYYLRTDRLFALMLTRAFPWYIKARSIPRRIRRAAQLKNL